jgi:class 3 adenylate cyclase
VDAPEVRYARSGDAHIAYQVMGAGPVDLVVVMGFISHLEHWWEDPGWAALWQRLSSFCRLILFDKRGTGLSDRVAESALPTLEQRMDDLRAVLDAVGSRRAALLGISEGGPMCILFAATYPDRTSALLLYGSFGRFLWAPDQPWNRTPEDLEALLGLIEQSWGTGVTLAFFAPSLAADPRRLAWQARFERFSASPSAARALLRMAADTDVHHVLPAITVPTLVVHRTGDRTTDVRGARLLAERIPGARYVELPGEDHSPAVDGEAIVGEIAEFLTGTRPAVEPDRILATVLFTDIVGSTERAVSLGDRAWRVLLDRHHQLVRAELARWRGREVDTAGDGFLATFDGPARAIRCAAAVREAVRALGLEIRAGLHTGECELAGGGRVIGIAVHIGARIGGLAGPGEVLASSTVKDLVAGAGITFEDRGEHGLRGVPDRWRLYAVT